jgi:hypothetical protein
MGELEEKMADILARIAKEQKIIDGSKAIRLATRNAEVLRKTDAEERDARKSLEYFHATLADLRAKRDQLAAADAGPSRQQQYGGPNAGGYRDDYERPLPSPPHDGINDAYPRAKQYSNLGELALTTRLMVLIVQRTDPGRYSSHSRKDSEDA